MEIDQTVFRQIILCFLTLFFKCELVIILQVLICSNNNLFPSVNLRLLISESALIVN